MKMLAFAILLGLGVCQGPSAYPAYGGYNRGQVDANPALAALLMKRYGLDAANQCKDIPSIGSVGLGVRAFMRNVEAALNDQNLNTAFQFIYYNENKDGSRMIVTAVSRYKQLNGEGGFFLHQLSVNPYANPSIKPLIFYFDSKLDAIKNIIGIDELDENAFVGCGDPKANWAQTNYFGNPGARSALPAAMALAGAGAIAATQAGLNPLAATQAGLNPLAAAQTGFNAVAAFNPLQYVVQQNRQMPPYSPIVQPASSFPNNQYPQYGGFFYNNPNPQTGNYMHRAATP